MLDQDTSSNQRRDVILVTGASSGIGRSIALTLVESGDRVIALGRDHGRLSALAAERPDIEPVVADLGRSDTLGPLADDLVHRFGRIDAVINNAAIQINRRMDDASYTDADIIGEIATNLAAPIVLTRRLLRHLQRLSRAAIVNVTTGLAFVPKRTAAVYSASKAGLHLFSEALRVQLSGTNVRVLEAVMPLVDTPMTAGRGRGKISPDAAAASIVAGLWNGPQTIYVGKARFLPPLLRFAPGVAARILQRM